MAERSRPHQGQYGAPPGAPRRAHNSQATSSSNMSISMQSNSTTGSSNANTAPVPNITRGLFKSHLTRRPTPATNAAGGNTASMNSTSSSSSSAAAAAAAAGATSQGETTRLPDVDIHNDTSDIVVRDKHGEIEIGDLPTPGALDDVEEGIMHDLEESKRERERLADAVKQHQLNHTAAADQPEELLEAVRRSLKAKVAALEEDQWMYESGDPALRR